MKIPTDPGATWYGWVHRPGIPGHGLTAEWDAVCFSKDGEEECWVWLLERKQYRVFGVEVVVLPAGETPHSPPLSKDFFWRLLARLRKHGI